MFGDFNPRSQRAIQGVSLSNLWATLRGGIDEFNANTIGSYTQVADVPIVWSISGGFLNVSTSATSKQSLLLRDNAGFSDGEVGISVATADDAGVAVRTTDGGNYYVAVIADASSNSGTQNTIKLFKRVGGAFSQIGGTQTIAFVRGTSHLLSLGAMGTTLTVKFDGLPILTITDTAHTKGRFGLRVNAGVAAFDRFIWQFPAGGG